MKEFLLAVLLVLIVLMTAAIFVYRAQSNWMSCRSSGGEPIIDGLYQVKCVMPLRKQP